MSKKLTTKEVQKNLDKMHKDKIRIDAREYMGSNIKNIKCELIDRFILISANKSSKMPNKSLKLSLGRMK